MNMPLWRHKVIKIRDVMCGFEYSHLGIVLLCRHNESLCFAFFFLSFRHYDCALCVHTL